MKTKFLFVITLLLLVFTVNRGEAFSAFQDVVQTHTNYDAILYLQQNQVIQGYSDGSFRADTTINRAEFTKIVVRAISTEKERAEYKKEGCFPDVAGSQWFTEFICYAKAKGIIKGYVSGQFKPSDTINFAEASKIITKAYSERCC